MWGSGNGEVGNVLTSWIAGVASAVRAPAVTAGIPVTLIVGLLGSLYLKGLVSGDSPLQSIISVAIFVRSFPFWHLVCTRPSGGGSESSVGAPRARPGMEAVVLRSLA